jgi:hypothetical protein
MKRCPTCQRTYTDDSLTFCLEDGTALSSATSDAIDPGATLVMPDPRSTSPARPSETFRPQQTQMPQASSPPYNMQPPAWSTPMQPQTYPATTARQGRTPAIISLIFAIAAFIMLILCFALGGAGADREVIGGIFVFSALIGLAGAVLGIVAISKTGKNSSPQNSRTMAIVALVLNCLYLLIVLILLVLGALATAR